MELYEIRISGYRKLREETRLKTSCKLVAVLGANEAGKSSLLSAIHRLNDETPFEPHEISHDLEGNETRVVARYLLSKEDLDAAGLRDAIWFERTKGADGKIMWSILPRPKGRDLEVRARLMTRLEGLDGKAKFLERLSEIDEDLMADARTVIEEIQTGNENLGRETIDALKSVSERFDAVCEQQVPGYFHNFSALIRRAIEVESADNLRQKAANVLLGRVPKFLLFGREERNLQASYPVSELVEDIPTALANLMEVAGCDLDQLLADYQSNQVARVDTALDRANERLTDQFRAVWKQSAISVMISIHDQQLFVQVRNPDKRRTSFSERSDGLRQFVALQSFTTCRGEVDPILLIDEAEQHLHYDAQADLIQMLATQSVSPKIIYTTHSAGCLPEDLGNGVRLISETEPESEWSKIRNKFWDSRQTTFSPLLMGMGASTLAFFPTRAAVVVEGESDMLLYPTMFRESLGAVSLGMQFVPGLTRVDRHQLPMMNTCGERVCYLLDGDGGGKDLRDALVALSISTDQIFRLSRSGRGTCELEDFLDAKLLADVVNELARRHYGNSEIVRPSAVPRYGKWDHVEERCGAAGIGVFLKVDVAYAILDFAASDPRRNILDAKLAPTFRQTVAKVMEYFEKIEAARA